jgi:ABC-type transport system involved in multi-copper enzyme maturation permease subunit
MIRLAWRQFRVPFAIAVGGLAVVAIVLGVTGSGLAHLYATTVANCRLHDDCQAATATLNAHDHALQVIVQALPLVVPVLIGMFWGAPLAARELESGTFRLAWTQGRTRWQWLVGKLVVVGLSSVVAMGLLSLMTTWWWSPINKANPNRFSPGLFGIFGVVPVGYAAFALAVGLLAGVVLRRTLPAMVTTLVAFIVARVVVSLWVRPHFASPVSLAVPLNTANGMGIVKDPTGGVSVTAGPPTLPNALVSSAQLVNHSGQQPSGRVLERICPQLVAAVNSNQPPASGPSNAGPAPDAVQSAFNNCLAKVGTTFHQVVTYQPASRYWPFQLAETALFIVAAIGAIALSYWWIRHRLR